METDPQKRGHRATGRPYCDTPAAWTDAHHIRHWANGGTTSLDNGVLLCRHHHTTIHQGDWTVRLAADGRPEFLPPPWIDPNAVKGTVRKTV